MWCQSFILLMYVAVNSSKLKGVAAIAPQDCCFILVMQLINYICILVLPCHAYITEEINAAAITANAGCFSGITFLRNFLEVSPVNGFSGKMEVSPDFWRFLRNIGKK